MKQYKYLWKKMTEREVIVKAFCKMRKGKTKRREVQEIEADFDNEVENMRVMIMNTRPGGNPEKAFKPKKHRPKRIFEHGKWRVIYMPDMHEQWLHHVIVLVLQPIVSRTAYRFTCGSFPGRGAHIAKRRFEKWISKHGFKYFGKADIRHFYDSVNKEVLFRELRIRIKDEWFLYVISLCLQHFKKGLPLGFYISQWLANYLLEPLDSLIRSETKVYIRYMDDIVFAGNNKRKLHKLILDIKILLGRRFRLKLKDNWQVVRFDYKGKGRPVDFMGFVFFRNRTLIRKRIVLAAARAAKRLFKSKRKRRKDLSAIVSYMGWFSCTDSYDCYLKHIKPYVNIGRCKKIISKLDRRLNNDRMERGAVFCVA